VSCHGSIVISYLYEAQMQIDPYTNVPQFRQRQTELPSTLGIKLMHNKSAVFYTDLLCSTLKDDYAIDIVHENVQLTRDEYDRDIKILLLKA
jgi:hypothetical protein